jgi:hypothetical protein
MNMDNTNLTLIVLAVALVVVAFGYIRERVKSYHAKMDLKHDEFRKDIWREVDNIHERLDKVDTRFETLGVDCFKVTCGQQYPVV